MAAAVEPGAAREKAETVRDLADILVRRPGRRERAGTAVVPKVNVVLRVEGDDALAGRPGGRVNAHAVLQGLAQKTIGIRVAKVIF